jgi:hypothetical protein
MEVVKMMACLLAEIKTNQEKMDANLEEMKGSQEYLKEEMLAKMETSQERVDVKLDAHHERIRMNSS